MVRNGVTVGVVGFAGDTAGGFSDDQVSLLQTFAGQAAIAVDNARLLREIEQRNSELAESLELQTATSEILGLISAHPGDLETVLNGILRKASELCDAPTREHHAAVRRRRPRRGGVWRDGGQPRVAEAWRSPSIGSAR